MDSVTDRAERPMGLLASLSEFWARVRAEAPRPEQPFIPTSLDVMPIARGLDMVLRGIGTSPSATVGPPNPIAKLPSGYEYRAIPAVEWAKAANLDPDVAALAWCLASEAPDIRKYPAYSVAIAEAVCNAARRDGALIGLDVVIRVCFDKRLSSANNRICHYYGRQSGRWCSSFQPPTMKHVKCAELVLARARAGMLNLLAAGATHWVDCDVQVYMHRKKPATNPSPENVMNRRYRSNLAWVGPVVDARGEAIIDPWKLCLLGPRGVSREEAFKMLGDGRRRWRRPG